MYSVYINQFKRNNAVVTTEELMFAVPSIDGFPVQKPVVKASEDSADNFSFTMESNSPYYDALLQKKTMIRVMYDGDVIFYGRVLSISTSTVYQTKNVTCEGYYAFLNDTYYEGVQEKFRQKITVSQFLDNIIANHNALAPNKAITRGTIGVSLPSAQDKYEPTSWTQTMSLISSLTSNYGGHVRVRHATTAPFTAYLDWYKYYVRDLGNNRPSVTVGKNILDISSESSVDDVFTRVIPVGDTSSSGKSIYIDGYVYDGVHAFSGKAMPVSFIRNLYSDSQLDDEFHNHNDYTVDNTDGLYGVIYKVMQFPDADTQEKLFNYIKQWIKDSYYGAAPSFTVKAVDLHIQNTTIPKILLGECVNVKYPIVQNGTTIWQERKLVCKAVQYDLFNPENNNYTFGIPTDLLEHSKSAQKKKATKKEASAAAASRPRSTPTEDKTITFRKIANTILEDPDVTNGYGGVDAYNSFISNGELSGTVNCYDPNEVYDNAGHTIGNDPRSHKNLWFTAKIVGKITPSNKPTRWVAFSESKGIFAYVNAGDPNAVSHWYVQKSGYSYQPQESGLSSFETIAALIESDPDSTYGGSSNAAAFRNNGKINGSVKCYDPAKTSSPSTHPEYVFEAQIVGKFGSAGAIKYVAISSEYGIFAYTHSAYPDQVKHWYREAKGLTYDNVNGFISTESSSGTRAVFSTDDDTPDGKKTTWFKTHELTGYGSQGEVLVGYDLTAAGDQWRVQLNVPIQYKNADGQTVIADGFVSASDFSVSEIPSFKTKIGIFDIVIAGKVQAQTIAADLAELNKLLGNSIVANTSIRSSAGYFTKLIVGSTDAVISNGIACNNIYYKGTSMGAIDIMGKIVASYNMTETDGTVKLQGKFINNQAAEWTDLASFDMAATTFYKNAVAAAWNNGGATAYFTASRTGNLDPGQSSTIYAYYKNSSGIAVRSEVSETGKYSTLQIKARSLRLRTPQGAVRPTTSDQTILPGNDSGGTAYDGLSQVVVEGSSNLTAKNIKSGVTIFGVTGTHSGGMEIPHYATTDGNRAGNYYNCMLRNSSGGLIHTMAGGSGNPGTGVYIPLQEGVEFTTNGPKSPDSGYLGWRSITVNVPTGSSHTSLGSWYYTKYQLPTGLWHHQFVLEQSGSSISGLSNNTNYKIYK